MAAICEGLSAESRRRPPTSDRIKLICTPYRHIRVDFQSRRVGQPHDRGSKSQSLNAAPRDASSLACAPQGEEKELTKTTRSSYWSSCTVVIFLPLPCISWQTATSHPSAQANQGLCRNSRGQFYGSIRVEITSEARGLGKPRGPFPVPVQWQKSMMNPRGRKEESRRLSIQPGPTGQAILFRS